MGGFLFDRCFVSRENEERGKGISIFKRLRNIFVYLLAFLTFLSDVTICSCRILSQILAIRSRWMEEILHATTTNSLEEIDE